MSVYFHYTISGPNSIHMETNDYGNYLSAVYINTNTVIDLTEDAICEWDMLTSEQRENLKDIAGQITAMAVE